MNEGVVIETGCCASFAHAPQTAQQNILGNRDLI
jgi:hypothetical protein